MRRPILVHALCSAAALLIVAGSAHAQDEDTETVFASGTEKSLTLREGREGAKSIEMIVRTPHQGVSYYFGKIDSEKRVATFTSEVTNNEGEEVEVPVTVRLGSGTATVIADFPDSLPAGSDPSGTYNKLDEKQHLAFMREGYKAADKTLNTRWAELKKSLPAELMADLTKRQRNWIEHKEYMSQRGTGDDFENSPEYWESVWGMTASRIHFFDTFVGKEAPPGIAGVYVDEHSGLVNIIATGENNYRFQIHVVRGPTYHLGIITKEVTIRDGKGRFVDTDKEAFWNDKPCTIDFEFTGNRLEIQCENSAYYHGVRAYFDGTYFKVKGTPEFLEE